MMRSFSAKHYILSHHQKEVTTAHAGATKAFYIPDYHPPKAQSTGAYMWHEVRMKPAEIEKRFIPLMKQWNRLVDRHICPPIVRSFFVANHQDSVWTYYVTEKPLTTLQYMFTSSKHWPAQVTQEKIVALLEHVVLEGYVHENLESALVGFTHHGQPLLWDPGHFLRPLKCPTSLRKYLLMAMCHALLSDLPSEMGNRTYFYRLLNKLRTHSYEFGTHYKTYWPNILCGTDKAFLAHTV